ncbi:MAG TPA: IclR family transcriptional regulator [Limnochordia bacterium]|nr:IclR family transcriptional regulator [Limnochordia bacterium]
MAKSTNNSNNNHVVVPAVKNALDIFELLSTKPAGLTLKQISSTLGIPQTSCFRVVKYLLSRGYLTIISESSPDRYTLGFSLLDLADKIEPKLRTLAKDVLRELANSSEMTAQLGVLHGNGVMYIEQALPVEPVSIIAKLRTVLPINVSAAGKVLLAYLPEEKRAEALASAELRCRPEERAAVESKLWEEFSQIRRQGYGTDYEEYARGIGCLAAPVFDNTERVIAGIGVTGHIASFNDGHVFANLVHLVKAAADKLSELMSQ